VPAQAALATGAAALAVLSGLATVAAHGAPKQPVRCAVAPAKSVAGFLEGIRGSRRADPDRDGLKAGAERRAGTKPKRRDTDQDRLTDGYEVRCSRSMPTVRDSDGDGIADGAEVRRGSDPLDPDSPSPPTPPTVEPPGSGPSNGEPPVVQPPVDLNYDRDGDGVSHAEELTLGTDPLNPDTDSDLIWDGDEIDIGEDPLSATDAEVIYVSPTGSSAAAGTKTAPRLLDTALPDADGGELVLAEPGQYTTASGQITERTMRDDTVRVIGLGEVGAAEVPLIELWGATDLTFRRIGFGRVTITDDARHRGPEYASARIRLANNVFSNPEGTCLTLRSGAHDLLVQNNLFHHCRIGINGPNTPNSTPATDTRDVAIVNNRMTDISGDGIQFGHWHEVFIHGNDIGPIGPSELHNDALQFTGQSSHVVISANHLHDSASQLLFIQPAFGPISDVLVVNNLIHDAAHGYAVQSQGIEDVRFINNTIWNSRYGGLLIRRYNEGLPVDNVVANNILYGFAGLPLTAVMTNNVVRTDQDMPPHNIEIGLGDNPGFTNARDNDFSLRPGSAAKGFGSPAYAPKEDILGGPRSALTPSAGAFE
jgi:hypothetical protein